MKRKYWLIPALTLACILSQFAPATAQDPAFGFLYGYGLGQAQRYRNNIPTPPYFAIHPPVYYGKRFERPYGDSPFASWPTLGANPNYRPELKQDLSQEVRNPHVGAPESSQPPMAQNRAVGKRVVIENPFVVGERDSRLYAAKAE